MKLCLLALALVLFAIVNVAQSQEIEDGEVQYQLPRQARGDGIVRKMVRKRKQLPLMARGGRPIKIKRKNLAPSQTEDGRILCKIFTDYNSFLLNKK